MLQKIEKYVENQKTVDVYQWKDMDDAIFIMDWLVKDLLCSAKLTMRYEKESPESEEIRKDVIEVKSRFHSGAFELQRGDYLVVEHGEITDLPKVEGFSEENFHELYHKEELSIDEDYDPLFGQTINLVLPRDLTPEDQSQIIMPIYGNSISATNRHRWGFWNEKDTGLNIPVRKFERDCLDKYCNAKMYLETFKEQKPYDGSGK